MKKLMLVTASHVRVFDNISHFMAYKTYLIAAKILYKEYEYISDEDIGLRGVAGVRAATAV